MEIKLYLNALNENLVLMGESLFTILTDSSSGHPFQISSLMGLLLSSSSSVAQHFQAMISNSVYIHMDACKECLESLSVAQHFQAMNYPDRGASNGGSA